MPTIIKDMSIELSTGTTIDVEITVEGVYDGMFGADADGNRGVGRWMVDNHSYMYMVSDNVSLTSEEDDELDEKIEEIVYEGDWDFEAASDEDDEDADLF